MTDDLKIAPADIRQYMEEVQRALQSSRVKTHFGKQTSKHWFFATLSRDTDSFRVIVTLEVRRRKGIERVYLREVRSPTMDELAEMGAQPESQPQPLPKREARTAVLEALKLAKEALSAAPALEEVRRGVLAYQGAALAGDYKLGSWRVSPAPEAAASSPLSEKILLCDRMEKGRDGFDIGVRLQRRVSDLAITLTILWTRYIYEIPVELRWTIERYEDDGERKHRSKLLQLGYVNQQPPDAGLLEAATTGETRSGDRLDTTTWGTTVGEPSKPPEDASTFFDLFERADLKTTQLFLQAAKAYHTSYAVAPSTTTGAIAYLVVAAESLIEDTLAVCPACNQYKGILDATRKLFFRELPCLLKEQARVKALLNRVYTIRSKHFHDAQFMAGELEQWHTTDILMPDSVELRDTYGRFMALVNGLLVAWLVRRVTGTQWARASGAFPAWREGEYFAVSVRLGSRQEPNDSPR